jgi:hypothetical protein
MENTDEYRKLTEAGDWKGIFELNGVNIDSFGTKKELARLKDFLESDEIVYAIISGIMSQTVTSNAFDFGTNTWLGVLTNERFLCLDCAMLTRSVDTQSIRLENVQAFSASQGWMFGKVTIDLGSRTIIIDNCMKGSVEIMASLANKLLKEMRPGINVSSSVERIASPVNALERLETLHKLHKLKVVSDDEYNSARIKIIASTEMKDLKASLLS